ncbi:MAG TPA: aldehyde dehydrogenase family protein [Myxococcota bacterium]|nr:aldehyde dehydrogenase family protein [Myxococcota bacterium]
MAIVTPIDVAPGARRRLAISSPVTGERIGEIEVQNAGDVQAALERARKAQPAWAALGVGERARFVSRALGLLIEKQDRIVEIVVRESGKPATEARMMEIFAACDSMTYWAKRAPKLLRTERVPLHGMMRFMKKLEIAYRPLGVVGVISPWNGPVILSLDPTVQALLAGNAVLLKPSEVTPFSGRVVADLFREAGLPEGVLELLVGDGETGAALCAAGVDKISFTGSVATGRRVAMACAERLIPCTLELGGKDPMIVCADADLDAAAGGAIAGGFLNAGQFCCGTERVYVVEEVADPFIDKVVARTRALRQEASGEFDVGAMFWPRQLEIVSRQVDEAVAQGARVLVGGRKNPRLGGYFYEPTVIVDVRSDMALMREENFGPVLPIVRVRDLDEAIARANDTRYGLGANVWTRDARLAGEIARRIDSGSVCINDLTMTYGITEAPFGGRKESGVGHVHGRDGLRGYCQALPIIRDRWGGKQAATHYPYSAARDAQMKNVVRWLYGTPLGRWLS